MGSVRQPLTGELPHLIRDHELDTYFQPDKPGCTFHVYHYGASRWGRYTRTECWVRRRTIASGGGGDVFLEQRTLPTTELSGKPTLRAVKRIDLTRGAKHEDIERELNAIAKFQQKKYRYYNCYVQSDGWWRTSQYLFIAMEYAELGDLHSYLYRPGQPPLPEHEVQDVVYVIVAALHEMHNDRLYHRDLKLKNILISAKPPDIWRVKLADFGLSKRVEETLEASTSAMGTLGYMAPELFGFIDRGPPHAIDMWAVGEITFQLLTKTPAFRLPGMIEAYMRNPLAFPFKPLTAARVSPAATDFIIRLMALQPDRRLTTGEAMDHPWLTGPPVKTIQAGPVQPPSAKPHISRETDTLTDDYGSWNIHSSSGIKGSSKRSGSQSGPNLGPPGIGRRANDTRGNPTPAPRPKQPGKTYDSIRAAEQKRLRQAANAEPAARQPFAKQSLVNHTPRPLSPITERSTNSFSGSSKTKPRTDKVLDTPARQVKPSQPSLTSYSKLGHNLDETAELRKQTKYAMRQPQLPRIVSPSSSPAGSKNKSKKPGMFRKIFAGRSG